MNYAVDTLNAQSAGIGVNHQIRSLSDGVRKNRIKHTGKLPYLRVIEALVKSNKQGARGGAVTCYTPFFDPEIASIIKARNPATISDKKIANIDFAIMTNTFFVDLALNGSPLNLFSLKDAPDLYKSFYSQDIKTFIKLYNKYSKDSKLIKEVLSARKLALMFLGEQYETGRLYELNIEEANRHTPFKEPIYSSNLCVAPETTILTDKGHEIISELEGKTVNIWNGFEWSETTVAKTGTNQKLIKIITTLGSIDCTPYHKWYLEDGTEVRTVDLKVGDKLLDYYLPNNNSYTEMLSLSNYIIAIENSDRIDDTYCVTEPKRNKAVFNGILTGQCLEILESTKPFDSIEMLFEEKSSEYLYIKNKDGSELIIKDFEGYLDDVEEIESKYNLEIEEIKTKNEIALCNIAAINLIGDITDEEYYTTAKWAIIVATWVIDNSEYPFPNLAYTAKKRKNVGIGLVGLAYELARNNLYYTSKSGKEHMHFIAERHSYMLHRASIDLAKEYGPAPWLHKTKYIDGWLPIDTYNKNVDKIGTFTYKYDWDVLRADLLTYGIYTSTLVAHMPTESSSQTSGLPNGLYPVRDLIVIKGDGYNKTIFIVPDFEKLQYQYEIAWDIPTKDLIYTYAIFQKFTDQGISVDYYRDFTQNQSLTDKELLTNWALRIKLGNKTNYYTNSKTRNNETTEQEAGCGSGGCSV